MNKHLLLLFSLFCLVAATTSLTCVTCHLRTQTDHCRRGYGICIAQEHETCMNLRIYQNGILQVSYMVCQKFCNNLSYNLNNRTYVHQCCQRDYCNFRTRRFVQGLV
ncbi:prostate and testis expressed protein 3 [Perognathus longimembris pacificus]|uniref:prostate and testis expressed protein 3 n=1 Tax=Perognathus longimembris pacificus TaxID=214514 RepID=UPI002019EE68|nr:prostate and testis expressed protein 3 [Perognathus longimembris pacificus]